MSLFNLGKKKEETKKPAYVCNGAYTASEAIEISSSCCNVASNSICCIKVLGSGCKSCRALFESTEEAVKKMKLPIEVEYITDIQEIMKYGIMSMPALVVNENVISMGKVLKAGDIENLMHKLGF